MTDNPYTLPDGNVQIAFSGGRTSAYMLHHILDANGGLPDRAKVVFSNTGREMPETLDFVQEVGARWGVNIVWVEYRNAQGNHDFAKVSHNSASRNGEPMIAMMQHFGFPPNRTARFCSHEGKTRTAKRFCASLGWDAWTVAIGIRADEAGRALKKQPREKYRVWYPLLDAGVGKREVGVFWRSQPFDLALESVKGVTARGNCDGCFLKSEAKRAMLARDYPDRAKWWADQERRFGGTFLPDSTWSHHINFVARQGDWIFDDQNDALCQADHGECTG